MIAPEPFFEPRGTPFSEYHRIRALLELGHSVDLVTYPFGRDVALPGLRLFRCLRPPFLHEIGIGPSLAKIPLDFTLTLTAIRRALSERYDAVHSHEEGSFIGVILAAVLGVPHLYDMHSSLPQQLTNFAFSQSRALRGAFSWMEIECAGACVNAPMVQIASDNFEDLTPASFNQLLDDIAAGRPIWPGPQIDRQFSAPLGGPTTLKEST